MKVNRSFLAWPALMLAVALGTTAGCKKESADDPKGEPAGNTRQFTVAVPGMT